MVERLNPLNSIMFSCLFKDMESKLAMLELLNAILAEVGEEPVAEILDLKSEYSLIAQGFGLKYGRVDVMIKTQSGRIFDIEVQIAHDTITNRSIFYGAKIIGENFKSGEPYEDMPKVRCINILDFLIREDNDDLVQPVSVMFEKAPIREATDVFKIYNIQMPIFRKKYKTLDSVKGNAFYTWLYILGSGYKSEEEMNMFAEMSEGMKNFAQKYNVAINDPVLVKLYNMEQDAIRDRNSQISYARNEGLRQGRQEGRLEGRREGRLEGRKEGINEGLLIAARGMKTRGLSVADIVGATGLTVQEVNAL